MAGFAGGGALVCCCFIEQVADGRADLGDHVQDTRRQGSCDQAQGPIAWAKAAATGGAGVVSALESQRSQDGLETLAAAAAVTSALAAGAWQRRYGAIAAIGVEPALHRPRGELQRLSPHGGFERSEIETGDRPRTYEGLDFGGDRGFELRREPLFSLPAASSPSPPPSSMSAQCSHTSQRASMSWRKA